MLTLRLGKDRGTADHDWLFSRHSFSFSNYFDPAHMGFSDLRVINDDLIRGGGGFGTHPHRDMEIFTYVLEGTLEHKDSMGNGSVIRPGDVQMMSAGTGVAHSEFNPSATEDLKLLQIWIMPDRQGVKPRYQQVHFTEDEKRGKLRLIISPEGESGSLSVYQNARVHAGLLDGAEAFTYQVPKDRHAYVHLATGRMKLNGQEMVAGDAAKVTGGEALAFSDGQNAEVLLFDLNAKDPR